MTAATGVSPASAAPTSATQQGTAGTTLVPGSIPTQGAQTTVSGGAAPASAAPVSANQQLLKRQWSRRGRPASAAPVSATQQVTTGTTFAPGSAASQTAAATAVETGVSPASAAPTSATQQGTAGTTLLPGSTTDKRLPNDMSGVAALPTANTTTQTPAATQVATGVTPSSAAPASATQQGTPGTTLPYLFYTYTSDSYTVSEGAAPASSCTSFSATPTRNCWDNNRPRFCSTQTAAAMTAATGLLLELSFAPGPAGTQTATATAVATGVSPSSAAPTSATQQGTAGTTLIPGSIPTQAAQTTVSGGAAPASAAPVSATQQVTAGTTFAPGSAATQTAAATAVATGVSPASAAPTSATQQGTAGRHYAQNDHGQEEAPASAAPGSATQTSNCWNIIPKTRSAATTTAPANGIATGLSPAVRFTNFLATQLRTAGTTLVPGSIPTQAAQTTVSGGAAPASAAPVSATQQVTAGTTFAPGSAATQTAAATAVATGVSPASAAPTSATQQGTAGTTLVPVLYLHTSGSNDIVRRAHPASTAPGFSTLTSNSGTTFALRSAATLDAGSTPVATVYTFFSCPASANSIKELLGTTLKHGSIPNTIGLQTTVSKQGAAPAFSCTSFCNSTSNCWGQ
ncbi:mucin-5AC-like [Mercenaria mercenaria]|uniref:mucin-5AC-like n=1 Tax=Mercenaria mercenaria TaxID=6596 RepID=UPI00234EC586|nr:mucin-5AC-like [Mercenaria mercenaria]